MQNLNELEKSKSTGVLIFAFNTATVDYVGLADRTSRLTQKFLNLPITLVTDHTATPKFNYDRVIRLEPETGNFRTTESLEIIEWRNFGRYLAYDLSPYDTTILLDGDYLVLDSNLLKLLDTSFDYKLMHHSYSPEQPLYELMGQHGLPFVWATVVLFRKSMLSKQYFDFIGRIQRNYSYYKTLYTGNGSYRNDYAFAIANNVLNGYNLNENQGIPWKMLTIEKPITDIECCNNSVIIRHDNCAHIISKQNMHVMDKQYLLSNKFKQFVSRICDAA